MIDPADFTPTAELERRQQALDERGLRATGSPAHAAYVADLARFPQGFGAGEVRTETLAMRRCTPSR